MRSRDLGHLCCPLPLLLLFFFSPLHTNSPLPFPLSSLSLMLSLSSLPKIGPAVHQPPAVPPAVCPPRTRSPTTIQVTGQEKEQAAFTIDQWRPLKQSFPFLLQPFSTVARTGKDKPLERKLKRRGVHLDNSLWKHLLLSDNWLKDHEHKHTHATPALVLTTPSLRSATPFFVYVKSHVLQRSH